MREILFRGKRLDNGEWIDGHLIGYEDGRSRICESHTDIFCYEKDRSIIQTVAHEVDTSTVGQYTGLKDKNGKQIWEWDVIKRFWLGAEIIYCVRYDGENAHFIGKALNKRGFTTFDGDGEMFEVIGNIHDNPELLEK